MTTENTEQIILQKKWSHKLENFIKKNVAQKYEHYFNLSIYDLEKEKQRLNQKIEKKEELLHKYNIVKYYTEVYDQTSILDDEEELNNENISKKILDDIEWLHYWINHFTDKYWNTQNPTNKEIEKYENILVKLKKLIQMFLDLDEDNHETIPDVLQNINTHLDFFFFSYNTMKNEQDIQIKTEIALDVLNKLETVAYIIFNKIDEYRYDIDVLQYEFDYDIDLHNELINLLLEKPNSVL
jgi:hypothetical protein